MEKLPTIILPPGTEAEATSATPCAIVSLGSKGQIRPSGDASFLRLGGIRLRCPRPQQLVEEFYVRRLGMQELMICSSASSGSGGAATDALSLRLVLPQRQLLHQAMHLSGGRSQQRRGSAQTTRHDAGAGLGEEAGNKLEGSYSLGGTRRASFGSQFAGRSAGSGGSSSSAGAACFAAFECFSPEEVEAAVADARETEDNKSSQAPAPKNWLKQGCAQFLLECVPVQKLHGLYRPYEHHRSDVFSRLSFCVSDVDAVALNLSQHMIRVQPAGQFLDMAYAASFMDLHNFRGRLLQFLSEYKMASVKALAAEDLKRQSSGSLEQSSKQTSNQSESGKRADAESTAPRSTLVTDSVGAQSGSLSSFSSAASMLQAEREGCLPAPSAEDLEAIESEDSCCRSSSVRFDTLPIERLPVFHHIELRTADAEATIAFYEEVLGMRVIDKKSAQGFGFTMFYLAFDLPTHTSSRYWLWMQRFSCICIKEMAGSSKVRKYKDLEPAECGFLGISFLCPEAQKERLLKRFQQKAVPVEHVEDEVYGRKVMLIRDPQNVPIRIVVTN